METEAQYQKGTLPNQVRPHSPTEMFLGWSNGRSFSVPYFEMRFYCPCAHCVDEHTGRRTLKREEVAPDVRATEVVAVGRYAIQITWSDRHSTGMYPYDLLYSLCLEKGLALS